MARSSAPPPARDGNRRMRGHLIKGGLEELQNLDAAPSRPKRTASPITPPSPTAVVSPSPPAAAAAAAASADSEVCPHVFGLNWLEWRQAKQLAFTTSTSCAEKRRFLEIYERWRDRVREGRQLPPYIESTALLLSAMADDQKGESPSWVISNGYGAALSRVVQVMLGSFVREGGLDTYRKRALSIGLPEEVVEVRQRVAHSAIPPLISELRWVSSLALQYLYQNYWAVQEKTVAQHELQEAADAKRRRIEAREATTSADSEADGTKKPKTYSLEEMESFLKMVHQKKNGGTITECAS